MTKWIFKFNPKIYDFYGVIKDRSCNNRDYWYYYTIKSIINKRPRARPHAKDIKNGDNFILFESGNNRGIVGRGIVLEDHHFQRIPQQYIKYDKNLRDNNISPEQDYFLLQYIALQDKIPIDMILSNHLIQTSGLIDKFNSRFAYNKITEEQWNLIIQNYPTLR